MSASTTNIPKHVHPYKILFVDDVDETAQFFAEQLRPFFQLVETASP